MSGETIPELPVATTITDGDLFVMVDLSAVPGFQTSQITASLIASYTGAKFGVGIGPMPAGNIAIGQGVTNPPLIKAISGDATLAQTGALTLASIGTPGTVGSSTAIPTFTTDYAGRITSYSTNVVIAPAGTLSGTTLAANVVASSLTSAAFITLPSLTTLANLTTVGTIGTGAWHGTPVALAFGGTNANLTATVGGIFYSTSTAAAILAGTPTARQMLQSGASGPPTWSTTTWPATTTANQLLYSSATSVIGEVTTANGGVLNTSGAGVPSITPTPTLGVNGGTGGAITLNGATSGSASIGVQAAAGTPAQIKLPTVNGTSGFFLSTDGAGNTSWAAGATPSTPNPQGSLTLASGVPVMTSTVTAATSILYTPYLGAYMPLWNGSAFVPTLFTEAQMTNILANAAVGNAGPSAAAANQVFDLYGWLNGATPTLTRSDYWQGPVFTPVTSTVTTPIASPGKVNWTSHGFSAGQSVFFTVSGGSLPTGLSANTHFYVIAAGLTGSQFEVSATVGGSAVNFTGTTTGTQTGSTTIGIPGATPLLNWFGSNLSAGQAIKFGGTGTLPVAIVAGTTYFVIATGLTPNQFEISATAGGGAITPGSGSGQITATTPSGGPAQGTGAAARGTAQGQIRVSGILTNTNAITNGPGAGFGTYLGSFATDSGGGTVSYSLGGSASGGTAAVLNVWNMYNRHTSSAIVTDSGAGYTYTTATNRQARASAGNQCTFLLGQAEDSVQASIASDVALVGAVTAIGKFGLGFDTITAFSGQPFVAKDTAAVAGEDGGSTVGAWNPGIGSHVVSSQEIGDGTNANTFDNSSLATLVVTVRN